jgi:hypothetical protein
MNYGANTAVSGTDKPAVFVTGTLGVLFLLLVGAVYTVALGYNYRYITLQLAKIENLIDIRDFISVGWPRDAKVFAEKYGRWCEPPEVIKVFWLTFLVAIAGVTISAAFLVNTQSWVIVLSGGTAMGVALITPAYYGRKIWYTCRMERPWKPIEIASSGNTTDNGEQHDSA